MIRSLQTQTDHMEAVMKAMILGCSEAAEAYAGVATMVAGFAALCFVVWLAAR